MEISFYDETTGEIQEILDGPTTFIEGIKQTTDRAFVNGGYSGRKYFIYEGTATLKTEHPFSVNALVISGIHNPSVLICPALGIYETVTDGVFDFTGVDIPGEYSVTIQAVPYLKKQEIIIINESS